jgi:hypothetical protein
MSWISRDWASILLILAFSSSVISSILENRLRHTLYIISRLKRSSFICMAEPFCYIALMGAILALLVVGREMLMAMCALDLVISSAMPTPPLHPALRAAEQLLLPSLVLRHHAPALPAEHYILTYLWRWQSPPAAIALYRVAAYAQLVGDLSI